MEILKQVIIEDTLDRLGSDTCENYLTHALCTAGSCSFSFNGNELNLQAGDLMIVRKGKLVEKLKYSADFRVKVVYVTSEFIELCTPQSNYGMKGQLMLFLNPIMHLSAKQQKICHQDFELIEMRLQHTEHRFYREMMICSVQTAILDFFDFHSSIHNEENISTQNASIMNRFLRMLESGIYREHREVAYYADCLCVTAKYLSEVSNKVSGYSANYWINRYTILDISRCLRNKSLSFVQISDMFGFSSPAYFSRYVQQHLGLNPSNYRNK